MLELLKVTIFSQILGLSKKYHMLSRRTATFVDYMKKKTVSSFNVFKKLVYSKACNLI
jgi:hypothetical protein